MKHILQLTIAVAALILIGTAMTQAGRHTRPGNHEPYARRNINHPPTDGKTVKSRAVRSILTDPFVDVSFGTGGSVRAFNSGGNSTDDDANSMAIQSDGKIVVAGSSEDASNHYALAVARFNTDGSVDYTFGTNGSVRAFICGGNATDDWAASMAIQPDGKIVASGGTVTDTPYHYAFAVARFKTDGTIDSTFGTNGSVRAFISGGDSAYDNATSMAIQSDGKIVAAGCSYDASNHVAFAVARFNTDGSIDSSFGTNGSLRAFISGGNATDDLAASMAIQLDGKIVAAGVSEDASIHNAVALARFNTDGSIDSTFGTNGSVRVFISGGNSTSDDIHSMAIQPDGKIVAAGCSYDASGQGFAVARFNADGSIDSSFGTSGSVRTFINGGNSTIDQATSMAIQSDGKIVAAGYSYDASNYYAFAVARFNADGSIDSSFGTSGSVRAFNSGGNSTYDLATSMAIQSDGKIVAAGYSADAPNHHAFAVARFLPALAPLPIQIASLTATVVAGTGVRIDWTTVSETNNYGFYVERRTQDTKVYTTVSGLVAGAGSSLQMHHYSWTDRNAGSASYVYRLKQVDLNGHSLYSNEIVVAGVTAVNDEAAPKVFQLNQNYPNPFNPTTVIKFSVEKQEHATVKVYNILGVEVAQLFDGMAEPGHYYKFNFDGSQVGCASGVYFYRIITDSHSAVRKMLMIK